MFHQSTVHPIILIDREYGVNSPCMDPEWLCGHFGQSRQNIHAHTDTLPGKLLPQVLSWRPNWSQDRRLLWEVKLFTASTCACEDRFPKGPPGPGPGNPKTERYPCSFLRVQPSDHNVTALTNQSIFLVVSSTPI